MSSNIDDEVELDNQYNIEQTYKEHISMEIIASNSISDVEQIAMVGVDNANISNNVSVLPGKNWFLLMVIVKYRIYMHFKL